MKSEKRSKAFKGFWWDPGNSEHQWFGELRWKPSGSPKLKLHYRTEGARPPENLQAFFGFDQHGTPISVLRAGQHCSSQSAFLSQSEYGAGHILEGIHVPSLDQIEINKMKLWLQGLGSWFEDEGFQNLPQDGAAKIEYRRPEDRVYQVSSNVTLKLCHNSSALSRSRERRIKYDMFISVEQSRSFKFARAFQWIDALRGLLHFARLRPVKATKVTFERSDYTIQVGSKIRPRECELLSGAIDEVPSSDPHPDDFVFRFEDVRERFADLCGSWFRFWVEQREAIGCYITTVYTSLTCEVKLICLTQALEAFHQRRFPPKTDEEGHFINRIRALCAPHGVRMSALVGDLDAFATSVRDTRHYYTHHDPAIKQKGRVAVGSKLTMMTYHLQYLFRLCVLSEFGLAADPYQMLRRQVPSRILEFY